MGRRTNLYNEGYDMDLRENMQLAWRGRRVAALKAAMAITKAPALFTREAVQQNAADFKRAEAEIRRWS